MSDWYLVVDELDLDQPVEQILSQALTELGFFNTRFDCFGPQCPSYSDPDPTESIPRVDSIRSCRSGDSRTPPVVIERLQSALAENEQLRESLRDVRHQIKFLQGQHMDLHYRDQVQHLQIQLKKSQDKADRYQRNLRKIKLENQRLRMVKTGLEKQSRWVEKQIDELLTHDFDGSTIHEDQDLNKRPVSRADSQVDSHIDAFRSTEDGYARTSFLLV